MAPLDGKTALVTGASRGIGRAAALRLAADGASVAVHYGTNEELAKDTVAEIQRSGGQAFPIGVELGVDGDVDKLFAALEPWLDGHRLDILVNNAGMATEADTIDRATLEQYDRVFAINVRAPLFIIQRALPLLSDGGRIINISSGVTWFAAPQVMYSMTKGALNVLTRSLANTLGARGITVNGVAPGATQTEGNSLTDDMTSGMAAITALGRVGASADIADVVAFFASDDSRWVTGETLEVNGGLWLGPRN
jgi:3-oxoacyl-[acyl-carrier protein] reductase